MIAFIRGELVQKGKDRAIVETSGGVGYELFIASSERPEFPETGEEICLHSHMYVREDRMQLYGFIHRTTRDFFRQLLTQKGVGPKLAVSILSQMGADEFRNAVLNNDMDTLTQIKGVGEKTAKRLILEMAEKLPEPAGGNGEGSPFHDEAVEAMIGLGFQQGEANRAVREASKSGDFSNVEELLQKSLETLEQDE
ncbi:MAG: Holliday junction branch migration protein RuvA [bacterium]